ncbi:MAG: methionine ABC transporter substrate-binding protein [Christensenellaceae bacterium]|nr:methionine ABC transporter substrate-binding protein [Christensenellaceae bacterium]
MKKFTAILLCLLLALSTATAFAAEKIVIGATPLPHAMVLEFIKEDFEALGYELEIQVATDYYLFNPATAAGDTDANYFQHYPFLNAYNAEAPEGEKLVAAFGVHYEPMGLFPGKSKSLDEIKKGTIIAVPNDSSNLTRSLLLVQEAGWITLPEDAFEKGVTPAEIIDNPYEIEFWEMNSDLVPSSLEDADYAVINGNHAIAAGFTSANDALITEPVEGEAGKIYTNAVVVRPEDLDKQWVKDLQSLILTDKVKEFMENEPSFGGAVKPTF